MKVSNLSSTAPFWQFKNNAGIGSEATMYVYGDIVTNDWGEANFPDDVIPSKFKDELKALGDVNTIHVRINSGGGSVFGAYAIMNLLKAHKAQIIVHIDGIAASAATLIAMAGDKIISAVGSVFMVHMPTVFTGGNVHELRKTLEALNKITDTMIDVYHAKTKIGKDELRNMLAADTWLSGQEAHAKGFVDEVEHTEVSAHLSADKSTAHFNGIAINLNNFNNKERLAAMLQTKPQPSNLQQASQAYSAIQNKEATTMTIETLKANHPDLYAKVLNIGKYQSTTDVNASPGFTDDDFEDEMDLLTYLANITKEENRYNPHFNNDNVLTPEEVMILNSDKDLETEEELLAYAAALTKSRMC